MNYDISESKMANYILDAWDSILYVRRDYSLHDHAQNEISETSLPFCWKTNILT
jgi:hypothetical protein